MVEELQLQKYMKSNDNDELLLVLLDKGMMAQLNETYLTHSYPTDVITFDYSNSVTAPETKQIIAEIIICPEMACDYANETGASMTTELILYIVHGLLHLAGYNDKTVEEIKKMRHKENGILALLQKKYPIDKLIMDKNDNPLYQSRTIY